MKNPKNFKKLALSALLLSAVAVPTAASAANETKATNPEILSAVTTVASSLYNPLELAKNYATNTVEDWEKTLEQYNKLTGILLSEDAVNFSVSIDMEKSDIKFDQAFAIDLEPVMAGKLSTVTTPTESEVIDLTNTSSIRSTITISDQPFERDLESVEFLAATPMDEVNVIQGFSKEISEGNYSLIEAEIALHFVAESKDAAKIKEALSNLLEQYKQFIAEHNNEK